MTTVQTDLFSDVAAPCGPCGLGYWDGLVSHPERAELVEHLQSLEYRPYEHRGYLGFRRIAAFGRRYDLSEDRLVAAAPWPHFLLDLLHRLAGRLNLDEACFVQALINEYQPGAGIGWHRDRPVYGEVLGISLLSPCVMRFRRRQGAKWSRSAAPLEPGSVYLLSGEARRDWEHSITPMTALRYSITFRTLA